MRGCWAKVGSAGGPLRSLIGGPAGRRWSSHILSTKSVAGRASNNLLSTLSTMTSGVSSGESRLRTLARNNNKDEFALLIDNVSLCPHQMDNQQTRITLASNTTSLLRSISNKNLIVVHASSTQAEEDNIEC